MQTHLIFECKQNLQLSLFFIRKHYSGCSPYLCEKRFYLAEQIEPFSTGLLLRKKLRIAYCLNEKRFYVADIRQNLFFPRENCEKKIEPIHFGCFELWKIASIKYKQLKCNLRIGKLIHPKISKNKNLSIEPFYPRVANQSQKKRKLNIKIAHQINKNRQIINSKIIA